MPHSQQDYLTGHNLTGHTSPNHVRRSFLRRSSGWTEVEGRAGRSTALESVGTERQCGGGGYPGRSTVLLGYFRLSCR